MELGPARLPELTQLAPPFEVRLCDTPPPGFAPFLQVDSTSTMPLPDAVLFVGRTSEHKFLVPVSHPTPSEGLRDQILLADLPPLPSLERESKIAPYHRIPL